MQCRPEISSFTSCGQWGAAVLRPYKLLPIYSSCMKLTRKIKVEVPAKLLERAQKASGAGISQTVRTGLELLVASNAYDKLRQLRGKVRFSHTWKELKDK
jgi:hypothetical protein